MNPPRRDRPRKRPGWTLALACLLVSGLLVPSIIATYQRRQTVRAIQRLNGRASSTYSIGLPLAGGRYSYGPLDDVYFLGPQVNDGNLRVLNRVRDLRVLTLTNTQVTDEGLAQLGRFRELNCLYIANIDHTKLIGAAGARLNTVPRITGKGLYRLKHLPKLQVVQLIGPQTTDEDLLAMKALKNLILIDLKDTTVTAAGVAGLQKVLPGCKISRR